MPSGHRRRRKARRFALDVLYQADVTGRLPTSVLSEWTSAGKSIPDYAVVLVSDVEAGRERIDGMLGAAAEEWTVARMVPIDRTILRIACSELLSGIPPAVAINEAVEAANELSTEDSARFVNGVLGRIARLAGEGTKEDSPPERSRP